MKSLIVSFLALMTAAASENNVSRPISLLEISDRIVEGKRADVGQFPYLVGLEFRLFYNTMISFCSGSLIGSTWVLTTAICIENSASVRVYLGAVDVNKPDRHFVVLSYNFIQHERFEWATWRHDIALIKIPRVEYTNNIKKIKLPSIKPPYPSHTGYRVTISGWGVTNASSIYTKKTLQYSNFLQHTDMTVMSNEECSKVRPYIFESKLCTAPFDGGKVCQGDQGDPMVLKDSQVLIGINSRTSIYCNNDDPVIFTRVTSYLGWIKEKTGIEY